MTETRPHIICHMVSSVDGKIDGKALQRVMLMGEYESNSKSVESEC